MEKILSFVFLICMFTACDSSTPVQKDSVRSKDSSIVEKTNPGNSKQNVDKIKYKSLMESKNPYVGKSIALLIWNTQKENDAHVYLGKIEKEEGKFVFVNKEKGWHLSLDADQLERLKPVSTDLKKIFLNADLAISLSMGDLTDDNEQDLKKTGIKWK